MSLNPIIEISKPQRSNHDRSNVVRFDCSCGILYPVRTDVCDIGDQYHCKYAGLVKTLPLLGPLMGSFKVSIHSYFIPTRLYNPILHRDTTGFQPSQINMPTLILSKQVKPGATGSLDPESVYTCSKSSLFQYLYGTNRVGLPFKEANATTQSTLRVINGVPILAYYDIFKSFYANTQETKFPVHGAGSQGADSGNSTASTFRYDLSLLDKIREHVLQSNGCHLDESPLPWLHEAGFQQISSKVNSDIFARVKGGLVPKTFMPDRFSSWLNTITYENAMNQSRVSTTDGFFNLDQFRFAEKLNNMLLRTAVSGGKYSDWAYVQYGERMTTVVESPQYIGGTSFKLEFEDVIQTAPANDNQTPLGTLGGRGAGAGRSNQFTYKCREHGYIMHMFSISPYVDYCQGLDDIANIITMSDVHVPAMDGIGFQDLLVDQFNSQDAFVNQPNEDLLNAIGKQPAYTELVTKQNQLHGSFADTNKLAYMVLLRSYPLGKDYTYSNYIHPSMFQQIFADPSLDSDNFWTQLIFDVKVSKLMSKRVMPHLG